MGWCITATTAKPGGHDDYDCDQRIASFIDILGFADVIEPSRDDAALAALIRRPKCFPSAYGQFQT